MRTRVPHLLVASLLLSGLVAACGNGSGKGDATVVLGIKSKLTPGIGLDSMHVVIKTGDVVAVDETYASSTKDLKFPTEFRLDGLEDGETVEATIDATAGGAPALTRLAATEAVGGKEVLLAVELQAACLQLDGGGAQACEAPQTCINGVCKSSHVAGETLPVYEADWATQTTDICKPKDAGDPLVTVGEGQADYLPMEEGALAQVEAGPQGGHHVWVAVRLKNLTQSGSITSLTGKFADLPYEVGPFKVIFTFDPDEGGYCKIYGLRFQLDGEHDIQEMLGKTLEITATVTDKDGDVGVGKKTVKLSADILG